MSKLALCIPAYNAASSLPTLFSSIRSQAIPFDEILLYNDCSTDDTAGIAKQLGATVIEGVINKGCSFGKNQLAEYAKSDWLFFLDSDDELLPNFSEVAFKWINKPGVVEMVLMGYSYVNVDTGEIKFEPSYDRISLLNDPVRFMIQNKIVNSSLIRKDAFLSIGGFDLDKDILFIEDRAFSIRAASANIPIDYDPTICFKINFLPDSMSSSKPAKWLKAAIHLWEKTFARHGKRYGRDISNQLFENAIWAAKYNDWQLVKKSLALAKTINPSNYPKASRLFLLAYRVSPYGAFLLREQLMRFYKKIKS